MSVPILRPPPPTDGGQLPSIRGPMEAFPDELLISTLVAYGQPRQSAEQLKDNPQLRWSALRFYLDVEAVGKGDAQARERVDYCREAWSELRKADLISDDPDRYTRKVAK